MTLPNSPEPHRCLGELSVIYTAAMECVVTPDEDGNLVPFGGAEVVDILTGYSVWCSQHQLLSLEEYELHGINEFWELV